MDLSFDRFKKISAEKSILGNDTTLQAEDINSPLSLIEWITNSNLDLGSPEVYIEQYSAYLRSWNAKNSSKTQSNEDLVAETYKNLLREITLEYTTEDEKRYLKNVDFNDPSDLDVIIPFYSTRLKEIVIFLSKKRDEAKLQKTKFGMFGTNEGVEKLIKKRVLELTNTESFITEFLGNRSVLDETTKHTEIQTSELYDIDDQYFNIDPCDHDPRAIDYDPKIFFDFTNAIRTNALDLGLLVQTTSDLSSTTTSPEAINVLSNSTDLNVNKFPLSQFEEYVNTENKLNLNNQKLLVNRLLGNNTTYLSSGTSATDAFGNIQVPVVSGDLGTASKPLHNFYNKIYPTLNYKPNTNNLYSKRQLGGFFTPGHLGTSSFASISPILQIDKSKITPNTIYEIPDPSIYGSVEYSFINHVDSGLWIKADDGNDSLAGDIIRSANLQKFYNYQTSTESNKFSKEGLAKIEDSLDFWTGEKSNIWANPDLFKLKVQNELDIDERQFTNLVNKEDIYKWQTDIFGNNYVLFKNRKPDARADLNSSFTPEDTVGSTDTNTDGCVHMNAGEFLNSLTGTVSPHNLLINGSSFTSTSITKKYIGGIFETACTSLRDILKPETKIAPLSCNYVDGVDQIENFTAVTTLSSNEITGFSVTEASYQDSDYLWDGHSFTDVICTEISADYDTNTTAVDFISSAGEATTTQPYISHISDEITIYDHRNNVFGDLWVRNINNSIVSPVSSALEGIYNKYGSIHSNIKTELQTKLKDFEIIYDTLILHTQNYIVYERLDYNFATNSFSTGNKTNYITTSSGPFDKSIHHFFNEKTNKIYTGYTRADTSYLGVINIYPEIFEFDIDSFKLQKVFPNTSSEISDFQLSDSITIAIPDSWNTINNIWQDTSTTWENTKGEVSELTSSVTYISIDHPILTYNELNDRFYMVATAELSAGGLIAQKNIIAITKTEFKLFDNKFELMDSEIYWPDFGYDTDISQDIQETIYLTDGTPSTVSVGPVSAFNYTLTIAPSALKESFYNAIIYDFNDGEEPEVVTRSVMEDYALLNEENADDISNPLQFSRSHTYFFTGSAEGTQYAYISAVDSSFNVDKFTIKINRQPYTLASAFSDLKLLECKSFLDNEYQEKTFLSMESSNPKYVINMALKGKQNINYTTEY